MDPVPLLQRILKKPSSGDLISLQTVLLSWEEQAASPLARGRAAAALALLGDFYAYLVGLESKLEAHAFAELASKMDMGAVGGVVVENMLSAGEKLLERILVGSFSEALMVLASRQYVKAFNRDLDAFYQQVAWQLRAHLWRFSAARRPGLTPPERAHLIDSLFASILDKEPQSDATPVVLGCLFQVLLIGCITAMLSD